MLKPCSKDWILKSIGPVYGFFIPLKVCILISCSLNFLRSANNSFSVSFLSGFDLTKSDALAVPTTAFGLGFGLIFVGLP